MALSSGNIGWIFWGLSCLCGFCYLVIYDGCFKKKSQVISNIYGMYLFCHIVLSILTIINSTANTGNTSILYYINIIVTSFAACVYIVLASLWSLSPPGYRVDRFIKYGIPTVYLLFLFGLVLLSRESANYLLFALYLMAAMFAYVTLLLMYYWFKNEQYIFNHIQDRKQLNLYLLSALFAGTMGMIDFIYPAFGQMGWLPNDYVTLWTRISDAVFYVPFVIPMIKYLNEMEWYSQRNILRMMRGVMLNPVHIKEEQTAMQIKRNSSIS